MSELVYRKPCEHGKYKDHWVGRSSEDENGWWCTETDRPAEQVLDPDKVLWENSDTTVGDVLAVLDGEDT